MKKELNQLENAASELLAFALKSGAQVAEVCGAFNQRTKITLEKQDFHLASADEGYSLGLRVLINQKQGFASCNTTEGKELKEIALRAVEIAGFSPGNPHYAILPSANISSSAPKEEWDESLYKTSMQTMKEWAKYLKNESTKDKRFRLNDGSLEISSGAALVTNSHGTHVVNKETSCQWGLMGMGVEGDLITSFDYFHDLSRKTTQTPERILQTTKKFTESVLLGLSQGSAKSYRGLVLFTPRAVADIFLSALSYHINGRSVVEGTGRWNLESLGKVLLSESLVIEDKPWATDRFGFSLFDREGTPTQDLRLIEKGVLKTFLFDHYSAKALGKKSTGHAAGGPSSIPTVSTHCLVVGPGNETLGNLRKLATEKQNEFLVVNRYSGQVDPVTGDFSGVAKAADWWNMDERLFTVKETLISGNIFDALGKSLAGTSVEREIIESQEESPYFLVDNISVTTN